MIIVSINIIITIANNDIRFIVISASSARETAFFSRMKENINSV